MSGKVAPVSLRDIMSEELARKLEETEEQIVQEVEEEIDDDLRLALELSKLEYENQNKNENTTISSESTDNDVLLAQALQAELENEMESERYARSLQEQERRTAVKLAVQDPRSKVSVSYGYKPDSYENDDEDYDSEEEDDDISEESLAQFVIPTKPYHETTKVNGRVAKEIITKHDPVFASMKNVEAMERTMESGNLSQSGLGVSTTVYNSLKEAKKVQTAYENRVRGNRADKSTSEQVLDHKTRVNLLKLLNSGVLSDLNGIISTGKEANVYYAKAGNKLEPDFQEGTEYAIKIYKTTLNEFKNRSEYIEGEFRFRHSKKVNERKLIKLWAEKEMRNLKRMSGAVSVPTPVLLRDNILVMKFIGKEGWAAPSLKDVALTETKANEAYTELCKMMRNLFQKCKLVHADLSEYNILYNKGSLCFIDCSQSVEHDHPKAFEFLKNDVNVMTTFFMKRGLSGILFPRELFEFITDINIGDENADLYLNQLRENALKREERPLTEDESAKNTLFQNTFIPRTLSQIEHPLDTDEKANFHHSVAGLSPAKSFVKPEEEEEEEETKSDQ